MAELLRGKWHIFREEKLVSLSAELETQAICRHFFSLQPRSPPKDLIFTLMENGLPLIILDDIRPIFKAYTPVGRVYANVWSHEADGQYRPTIIEKYRAASWKLSKADMDYGGAINLIFDETTDFCSRHPVNIIVHTPKCCKAR